jgi:DNA-directed RNA polymerase subunit RPC12/RpoP
MNLHNIKPLMPMKSNEKCAIHNVVCSACGEEIPEHEKDVSLLSQMSISELDDVECIDCEMKYRDSADLDMFG